MTNLGSLITFLISLDAKYLWDIWYKDKSYLWLF